MFNQFTPYLHRCKYMCVCIGEEENNAGLQNSEDVNTKTDLFGSALYLKLLLFLLFPFPSSSPHCSLSLASNNQIKI